VANISSFQVPGSWFEVPGSRFEVVCERAGRS